MDNNVNVFGEYVFYEDNKEIFRSKNLLTKFGKRYLTQYLAGQSSASLKDIALGIGSVAATDNDTQLGFEFYKSPVSMNSIDIQTSIFMTFALYRAWPKALRICISSHISTRSLENGEIGKVR